MTKKQRSKAKSMSYLIVVLLVLRTLVLKREHAPLWPSIYTPSYSDLARCWHWLAFGNNAAAIQAITAVLGVVGLAFYTVYTRTQKNLSLAQERASVTPILAVKAQDDSDGYSFTAINLGRAVAFDIAFRLVVSELPSGEIWKDAVIDKIEHFPFFLANGVGNATLSSPGRNITREFRVSISYSDAAERHHTLKVYGATSTLDRNVLMMPAVRTISSPGDPVTSSPLAESFALAVLWVFRRANMLLPELLKRKLHTDSDD